MKTEVVHAWSDFGSIKTKCGVRVAHAVDDMSKVTCKKCLKSNKLKH